MSHSRRIHFGSISLVRGGKCAIAVATITCGLVAGSSSATHAAGTAVVVPPAVVQTTWREPQLLTKDARPRFDAVKTIAGEALESIATFIDVPTAENFAQFQIIRAALVTRVAARVNESRAAMLEAWSQASLKHQMALIAGLTTLGVGYEYGSDNPKKGLDCSGLVAYAWQKVGIALPLQSKRQWESSRDVKQEDALPGDIVWYPGHTMMYLGVGDAVLHSARLNLGVRMGRINWKEISHVKFGNPEVSLLSVNRTAGVF
ncbi:MAG: hypothetical protein EBY23_01425 [Actinobacteria bacterium]|jgi:cell wall-associated NlpC family hydrolase|uniref:Unannotated protein n=1 Tax=freshwater metagenome TaxID=449393 RepID=A0A6J7UMY2_9ZZZZ|nr:hypothetical protein [Actinomycetota bacterium]NDG65580.1 hypothetical protein [Actinomycetota bacterium]